MAGRRADRGVGLADSEVFRRILAHPTHSWGGCSARFGSPRGPSGAEAPGRAALALLALLALAEAAQRQQHPDDVTGVVTWLMGQGSGFVTGQVVPVNGGFVFN